MALATEEGQSRAPSRDVRAGSRRVVPGQNSFLHTGNTVKHKTQTKQEREREREREKEGEERRGEQREAGRKRQMQLQTPSFLPCGPRRPHPIPSFPAAPSQC